MPFSFNLAIENLIFSSHNEKEFWREFPLFQSRNRESYLFKLIKPSSARLTKIPCFNLAIENLIFSSPHQPYSLAVAGDIVSISQSRILSFQVPNVEPPPEPESNNRFNLAIENLIFSSYFRCAVPRCDKRSDRFNLAIENLIFSRYFRSIVVRYAMILFQSRNRESYLFKDVVFQHTRIGCLPVSISQSRILSFQAAPEAPAEQPSE